MLVDAAIHPSELPLLAQRGMSEAVCVVFDVLRATSSMVTGLANGVREILPARTIDEAKALRVNRPNALLGGERHGEKIDGFDLGNSPSEYIHHKGSTVITTTTNGTLALRACERAHVVLVGAILNLSALVETIKQLSPRHLIAVCSGTGADAALEDTWAAGALLVHFNQCQHTDAARIAVAFSQRYPEPYSALEASSNGRALAAKNKHADLKWCAQKDLYHTVGVLETGSVRAWKAAL